MKKTKDVQARVCPKCAYTTDEPMKCCPRCNAELALDREENMADKTSSDSFPASDPPSH